MNDTPRTSLAAGTPSKNWEATAERLFICSWELELENNRLKWLIRQILIDLPQKRDWLNPEYEQEMRAWANSGTKTSSIEKTDGEAAYGYNSEFGRGAETDNF